MLFEKAWLVYLACRPVVDVTIVNVVFGRKISDEAIRVNFVVDFIDDTCAKFILKLLLRCGLLAWTRFRLILRNVLALSGL